MKLIFDLAQLAKRTGRNLAYIFSILILLLISSFVSAQSTPSTGGWSCVTFGQSYGYGETNDTAATTACTSGYAAATADEQFGPGVTGYFDHWETGRCYGTDSNGNARVLFMTCVSEAVCNTPDGWEAPDENGFCPDPVQDEDDGCGNENTEGNPCNVATGNKFQSEIDFSNSGLTFTRSYNSRNLEDIGLGKGWRYNFQKNLSIYASGTTLIVISSTGRGEPWTKSNGIWLGDADSDISIIEDATGFTLTKANSATERYDLDGQIESETDTNNNQTTYTYNGNDELTQVSNHYGHSITFTYSNNKLDTVTDSDGSVYNYEYDINNNLTDVIKPDQTPANSTDNPRTVYLYEKTTSFPNHLTGITDENGDRYATYDYDVSGKAISTEHSQTINAVGQGRFLLDYQSTTTTMVTDAVGTQELWTFDEILGAKKLTSKVNQTDSKGITQTWDGNGNKLTRTDAEGRTTKYTYNATNQTATMTEAFGTPDARTTTYQYVSADIDLVTKTFTPSIFNGNTKEVVNSYDANQNITTVTINGFNSIGNPVSRATTFGHDSNGKIISIDGPRTNISDITTLQYYNCTTGVECGQLKTITNALGHITNYNDYDNAARLKQSTDANDVITTYNYHPRGWLLSITQTPTTGSARTTTYEYDAVGQLTKTTLADGSEQNYVYDAAHDLREISDNLGNKIEYSYDAKGNRTSELIKDPNGILERSTITAYDMRNFIESINTDGSITQLINDAVGNLSSQTDPKGNPATSHSFDPLDRLSSTIDALTNNTDYQYNVADQLTEVQAPNGATTQYEYDDLGNQTKEISPDRGTLVYTHDDAGNLVSMADDRGITTSYVYDELNRLSAINYPNNNEDVTYLYDQNPNGNCGFSIGRLCEVTDNTGTHQSEYDAWGNVLTQTWQSTTSNYTIRYQYDEVNRLSRLIYPSGMALDYIRDEIGRVKAVLSEDGAVYEIIADQFTYRADQLVTGFRHGNGQIEQRNYDLQGRLSDQTLDSNQLATYIYDANGNLTQNTQNSQSSQQRGFSYDPLDRLDFDDWISGAITGDDWQYSYDANGNRLSQQQEAQLSALTYQANSNQLSTIAGNNVVTDQVGNITTLPRTSGNLTLTYNQQGQLTNLINHGVTTNYTYNHQRQRLSKQQSTYQSQYLYDLQGRLLATLDNNGNIHQEYLYANQTGYNPIQTRTYDDTEANTVEAKQALAQSQYTINEPDSNGQCENLAVTNQDRDGTSAIFTDGEEYFGTPPTPPPGNPALAWLVPILLYLFDDDEPVIPPTTPDVPVSSITLLNTNQVNFTWSAIAGATEYVIDVATSEIALNNKLDIARHCAQGQTSAIIDNLPLNGTDVYIRIWAKVNGVWQYQDYNFDTEAQTDKKAQVTRTYLIADHLNTPRFGYDDSKTLTWRWASDGFGNQLPSNDVDADGYQVNMNIRFPGQYADQESRLVYNWNRYYDPEIGRYVTSDPIGFNGGINTYGYTFQNPSMYIDPLGLEVTMNCRPLDSFLGSLGIKHCSVIVWHWEVDECGNKKKVIDEQFSLSYGNSDLSGSDDPTFVSDTNAFNSGNGNNDIPPPAGIPQNEFDKNVRDSGNNFTQGPYEPISGPNSNTAADNIIEKAGGIVPNIPGAVAQNHGEE